MLAHCLIIVYTILKLQDSNNILFKRQQNINIDKNKKTVNINVDNEGKKTNVKVGFSGVKVLVSSLPIGSLW